MLDNGIIGLIGSALVLIAYLPQTYHLIKEHCSAGISPYAYIVWLTAAVLLLIHAITIKDTVFISLQTINTFFTGLILFFAIRFKNELCASHRPN
jgi:uncharacterized protein with PQ loop repeat